MVISRLIIDNMFGRSSSGQLVAVGATASIRATKNQINRRLYTLRRTRCDSINKEKMQLELTARGPTVISRVGVVVQDAIPTSDHRCIYGTVVHLRTGIFLGSTLHDRFESSVFILPVGRRCTFMPCDTGA